MPSSEQTNMWKIQDQGGRNLILKNDVVLKANATMTLEKNNPLCLSNTGGTLINTSNFCSQEI